MSRGLFYQDSLPLYGGPRHAFIVGPACIIQQSYNGICSASHNLYELLLIPGNGTSCMSAINSSTTVQYNTRATQPFILRCPVQLCTNTLPNITWCKVNKENICDPVIAGPRISPDQEQREKENYTVHILKFYSTQIDDSGLYKCLVVYQEQQMVIVIKVRVFGKLSIVTKMF